MNDAKQAFDRDYQLVVAPTGSAGALGAIESAMGLDVSDLRCEFKAKKNLKATEPNTCTAQVYNLGPNSRRVLETASKLVMRLEAGYKSTGTSQIFLGEVRHAWTQWNGPDCVTTITTGDSEKEIQESRIHMSVGPSVPVDVALTAIARALKVGEGNVAQAVATLKTKGVAAMFGPGTAISGNAARELTDYCRSAGLEWSIQDGALQILDFNKPLTTKKAIELSPGLLVGSPTIDFQASSKEKRGGTVVKATCFIVPELAPGRLVLIQSKSVTGGYRIEEIEYEGDTHGTPWFAHLSLRKF